LSAGHGREEDERRALADGRFEPVERADVFVIEVDVDEGRDAAVLEHLASERGIALGQVGEQLADSCTRSVDLACAARLISQRRGDADATHVAACWRAGPAQNST
jgi:hypothetical protein